MPESAANRSATDERGEVLFLIQNARLGPDCAVDIVPDMVGSGDDDEVPNDGTMVGGSSGSCAPCAA